MPTTDQEKQRKYRRDHYHRNKEQYYRRNEEKRDRLKQYIVEAKAVPCVDCGISYPPYVMDFDHREASGKLYDVSQLVNHGSWDKLKTEIAKCDVVCSNCHRVRTFK